VRLYLIILFCIIIIDSNVCLAQKDEVQSNNIFTDSFINIKTNELSLFNNITRKLYYINSQNTRIKKISDDFTIHLGEYINPDDYGEFFSGVYVFKSNNTGTIITMEEEISFKYEQKGDSIIIHSVGQRLYGQEPLNFTLTLSKNGKILSSKLDFDTLYYHSSILYPLKEIFIPDIIGQNIEYFNSKYGPPERIYDDYTRIYKIELCSVMVYGKDSISALGIENIDSRCNFDLRLFDLGGMAKYDLDKIEVDVNADSLDITSFDAFYVNCAYCGNATTPTLYGVYNGPHSVSFINVISEIDTDIDNNSAILRQIFYILEKTKGSDYLIYDEFNGTLEFTELVKKFLKDARIKNIIIGYDGINDILPHLSH
jgi:hypothetical protein